jgi:hypothetical protein
MNTKTTLGYNISHRTGTKLAKTAGLLLLLSGFFIQGQAAACGTDKVSKTTYPGQPRKATVIVSQKNESPAAPDYYQSSDNPYRAD